MAHAVKIKDMTLENLRQLMRYSIKDVEDKDLSDDKLKRLQQEYGDYNWLEAMKRIGDEISPRKLVEKGEETLQAVFLASLDEGRYDNVVYHYVLTPTTLERVRDRGMRDLEFGGVYTFPCKTTTGEKGTFYNLKHDAEPEMTQQLSEGEVMKRLHKMKKSISDLENNEIAVIEVNMTNTLSGFQDEPIFYDDPHDKGLGLQFYVKAIEEREEKDPLFITLFFNPQKYGEVLFLHIFPEKYLTEIVPHFPTQEELLNNMLAWIIPHPPELKSLAIGRVSIKESGKYAGSKSFSPCVALIMDIEGQTPDFLKEIGVVEEEEAEEEEEEEEVELKRATEEVLKSYLEWTDSPNVDAEELNTSLAKKGYRTTNKDLDRVKKKMGLLVEDKGKGKPKKKSKTKTKKRGGK